MKKKILVVVTVLILVVTSLTGCATLSRGVTDIKSEFGNGLYRTIKVYTYNGELIATHKGKIDIEISDGGKVKFDYNGKRYIYYNCTIETVADK